jgi:DNA-binding winged helix-turn-helix (wHTH) protein
MRNCYNNPMSENPWSQHPSDYREVEVQQLLTILRAGECVSLIGLSGMGKSNLLGYLVCRASPREKKGPICVLVDCNRLPRFEAEDFFQLALQELQPTLTSLNIEEGDPQANAFESLDQSITLLLETSKKPLALLLDGFDDLARSVERTFFNQLRSLRDRHKYQLSFLLATRQPLETITGADKIREFDDLLVSNQIWLNPLSEKDALWTIHRFEDRLGKTFDKNDRQRLLALSGHHPGLLRTLASAWPISDPEDMATWVKQTPISRECELLLGDLPCESQHALYDVPIAEESLESAGLVKDGILFSPIFQEFIQERSGSELRLDAAKGEIYRGAARLSVSLTAKEHTLLAYLLEHEDEICEKDELIRAVWPEDKVYEQGIRDDSLAQLVRRLRTKIEPDPSNPTYLQTAPGRGYRLIQPD